MMVLVRPILLLAVTLAASLTAAVTPLTAQVSLRIEAAYAGPSPLEQLLSSRVSLSSGELSIEGLAELLRHQFSINVRLDRRALDDVGLSPETTVSAFDLSNVVLEQALFDVLNERDLDFWVYDEVLVITTPEEAENNLQTRVYPVADLVIVGESKRALTDRQMDDYDTLIETIISTIAPDTWDEAGGAGSIEPFPVSRALVISQTRDVHRQIGPLLETLRHAKTVSWSLIGGRYRSRTEVGSRPYVRQFCSSSAASSSTSTRYVYQPRGSVAGAETVAISVAAAGRIVGLPMS